MRDSQQEFERAVSDAGWASNYQGDGQYAGVTIQFAWKMWQACQKLNDARINTLNDAITEDKILESHNRELLAANEGMREALQAAKIAIQAYDYTGSVEDSKKYSKAEELCDEAIKLNIGDFKLVKVGYIQEKTDYSNYGAIVDNDLKGMTKLYTIQTKSNT